MVSLVVAPHGTSVKPLVSRLKVMPVIACRSWNVFTGHGVVVVGVVVVVVVLVPPQEAVRRQNTAAPVSLLQASALKQRWVAGEEHGRRVKHVLLPGQGMRA